MHVGIIMDGNGRWAKAQSLPRLDGHNKGANTLVNIVKSAPDMGIKYLTLYAFSTENWHRPAEEVQSLIKLLRSFLNRKHKQLVSDNVRLKTIGNLSVFDTDIQQKIRLIKQDTAQCTGITMVLALNYGGRDEIVRAVQKMSATDSVHTISEQAITHALDTAGLPDVDLIIRTAGEQRLSNFLLWQSAYAELLFVDKPWPAFTPDDLQSAIHIFHARTRNFGGGTHHA